MHKTLPYSLGVAIVTALVWTAGHGVGEAQDSRSAKLMFKQSFAAAVPSARLMSSYTYATWTRVKSLSGGGQSAEPPDTDCPPLPTQHCVDSWKEYPTINPFPDDE